MNLSFYIGVLCLSAEYCYFPYSNFKSIFFSSTLFLHPNIILFCVKRARKIGLPLQLCKGKTHKREGGGAKNLIIIKERPVLAFAPMRLFSSYYFDTPLFAKERNSNIYLGILFVTYYKKYNACC